MSGELEGRACVVTGASRGIGESIALACAAAGADVLITARSIDRLEALAVRLRTHGVRAYALGADMRVDADVEGIVAEAVSQFGRIDLLVNNAATIHENIDLIEFDPAHWREVVEVNLTSVAMLTRAALGVMIPARRGSIVNISSVGARRGAAGRSAYRATKAALVSLTESVAAEVKRHGIDVNCVCPGGVDTEGYREAFGRGGREANPKLMDPDEIARVVVFLASDAARAITGTAIDAWGSTNPLFD